MKRHGFMAEYYAEAPVFLHKIPKAVESFAVLLEPMSVVEKGIDHAFLLQRRLLWGPKLALVLGGGPVGLLAAAVLRARGLRTVVFGREPASDLRAQIAMQLGAEYLSVDTSPLFDLPKHIGLPDIIIEATGNAKVVFDAMEILAAHGVLGLLSVTGGSGTNVEPIDRINQLLVLGNQVVFGSVNANPRHFAKGVEDFVTIEKHWPGALSRLLTNRIPWQDFNSWFTQRGSGIKTTLEIGS
jgi:glucose 1-dehydrogenase